MAADKVKIAAIINYSGVLNSGLTLVLSCNFFNPSTPHNVHDEADNRADLRNSYHSFDNTGGRIDPAFKSVLYIFKRCSVRNIIRGIYKPFFH